MAYSTWRLGKPISMICETTGEGGGGVGGFVCRGVGAGLDNTVAAVLWGAGFLVTTFFLGALLSSGGGSSSSGMEKTGLWTSEAKN